MTTAGRGAASLLLAAGIMFAAGAAWLPSPSNWVAFVLFFAWLGLFGPSRVGYPVRVSAWLAAGLFLPPLFMAILSIDGVASSRISLLVLAGSAVAMTTAGNSRLREPDRRAPTVGIGQLSVGVAGLLVIADSYLLHGDRGWLSALGQDHLFHGALVGSFIESNGSVVDLLRSAPDELAYVPSGLHAGIGAWFDLAVSTGGPTIDTRLAVQVAVPLVAVLIAWLFFWSAMGFVMSPARKPTSLRLEVAIALILAVLFAGPFLWLRVSGMWPALISISALALACVVVVDSNRDSEFRVSRDPWCVGASGVAVAVAIMAWPLMVVPIALAVLVGLLVMLRHSAQITGGLRGSVFPGAVVCVIGSLGLAWSLATLRRPQDPLSGGQGGLGVLDYRWLVIALIATLAVPSIQRRLRVNLSPAAWAILGSGFSIVVCGLLLDVIQSTVFDTNGTYYSNKLILLGLMIVLPVMAWGVIQPLGSSTADRAFPRRALLSAGLLLTSLASLWFPWGAGSWVPYTTTGFFPGVGYLANSTFGSRSLVSDEVRQDALWAICTNSMIVRYPPDSGQEGAPRYAASWAQVLAGRTDKDDWDAFKLVYPQFDQTATVPDLRYWLDAAVAAGAAGSMTLVVPADLQAAVQAELAPTELGRNVSLRVTTPEALRSECETKNG
jgi:hypothetical protein